MNSGALGVLLYPGLAFRNQKYPSHGLLHTFLWNRPNLHKFPLGISPLRDRQWFERFLGPLNGVRGFSS